MKTVPAIYSFYVCGLVLYQVSILNWIQYILSTCVCLILATLIQLYPIREPALPTTDLFVFIGEIVCFFSNTLIFMQ